MKQGYWSRIARLGFCFVLFFVNHQESGYAHENVLGKFSGYKSVILYIVVFISQSQSIPLFPPGNCKFAFYIGDFLL